MPKGAFWKQMPQLQVLLLHHNQIDSIHALQQLVAHISHTDAESSACTPSTVHREREIARPMVCSLCVFCCHNL